MQLGTDARGVYPIAPTPFFDDGRIVLLVKSVDKDAIVTVGQNDPERTRSHWR